MLILIRTGKGILNPDTGEFTDVINRVSRIPRQHNGWRFVRYMGRRYQLQGGIRTREFICLNHPI
jgi:hypothetical protein